MKFALVEGKLSEAEPQKSGTCQCCSLPVISKCGKVKIWHWAHKGRRHCDHWWESETEWHRAWKDAFPIDWQEVVHFDPDSGEKHIADVKTENGLVIEIQHSVLKPDELESREQFYDNMVWIVDGKRGQLDEGYFRIGLSSTPLSDDHPTTYPFQWWGRSHTVARWSHAKRPVFFDFGSDLLWHLVYFDRTKKKGFVRCVLKLDQITQLRTGQLGDIPSIQY